MENAIWFRVDLIRFRKDFSVCTWNTGGSLIGCTLKNLFLIFSESNWNQILFIIVQLIWSQTEDAAKILWVYRDAKVAYYPPNDILSPDGRVIPLIGWVISQVKWLVYRRTIATGRPHRKDNGRQTTYPPQCTRRN